MEPKTYYVIQLKRQFGAEAVKVTEDYDEAVAALKTISKLLTGGVFDGTNKVYQKPTGELLYWIDTV